MSEFEQFRKWKLDGMSAHDAYRRARQMGVTEVDSIRMLRSVFELSLRDAKEVTIVASGTATSLEEHEASVASDVLAVLKLVDGPPAPHLRKLR